MKGSSLSTNSVVTFGNSYGGEMNFDIYLTTWNKSVREGQIYVFTCMWIFRNLTEDHEVRRGGKIVTNREGGKQNIRDS